MSSIAIEPCRPRRKIRQIAKPTAISISFFAWALGVSLLRSGRGLGAARPEPAPLPRRRGAVSALTGDGRFCNRIAAVKRSFIQLSSAAARLCPKLPFAINGSEEWNPVVRQFGPHSGVVPIPNLSALAPERGEVRSLAVVDPRRRGSLFAHCAAPGAYKTKTITR
jgi:hypothetical protein